ncbi:hypothetical protein COLO4_27127 [Corchorus olitorius]|uniref:Uncharacterized protein n=1 Tax=Corchorus olitorius TaxID=93759 RepID=A0A1R3HSN0_9ROSI|nr:hypothetical protein COLO4_27127 [Corchorus olitorius]
MIRCLKSKTWLNETVIDLVVKLCNEESRYDTPLMSRIYMTTQFSGENMWFLAFEE